MRNFNKSLKLLFAAFYILQNFAYTACAEAHDKCLSYFLAARSQLNVDEFRSLYSKYTQEGNYVGIGSKMTFSVWGLMADSLIQRRLEKCLKQSYAVCSCVDVISRHLLYNAYDACVARNKEGEGDYLPKVNYSVSISRDGTASIILADNGAGMSLSRLQSFMESLGSSKESGDSSVWGEWGQGAVMTANSILSTGLSCSIIVRTRSAEGRAYEKCYNDGSWTLNEVQNMPIGTTIQVDIRLPDGTQRFDNDIAVANVCWQGYMPQREKKWRVNITQKIVQRQGLLIQRLIPGLSGDIFIADLVDLRRFLELRGLGRYDIFGNMLMNSADGSTVSLDIESISDILKGYSGAIITHARREQKVVMVQFSDGNISATHYITDNDHLMYVLGLYGIRHDYQLGAVNCYKRYLRWRICWDDRNIESTLRELLSNDTRGEVLEHKEFDGIPLSDPTGGEIEVSIPAAFLRTDEFCGRTIDSSH